MAKQQKILVISFQSLSANSGEGMARLGFYLSQELHKRGILYNFIVSSKGKFETPFPSSPVSFFSRYYLLVVNKVAKMFSIQSYKIRLLQEHLFDWFCSFKINSDITTLITTNTYLYRTLKKAREKGVEVIILPANPNDNFIYNIVKEEQKKLGIYFTDAYTYDKRLRFFNKSLEQADKIITTYPTTYETFMASAVKDKVIQVWGHLKPDFKEVTITPQEETKEYNVAYLAYTVLLKGLQYLLEAWQGIMSDEANSHMHLHIGGSIDDRVQGYLTQHFGTLKNVHYVGYVKNVEHFLEGKQLFVVPSLVDGGPVTALEAAHYGVPVILTRNCGSRDFFEKENTGRVVEIRDAAAIKENILWASSNRKEAAQMGLNAKKGLDGYNMTDLVQALADTLQQTAR